MENSSTDDSSSSPSHNNPDLIDYRLTPSEWSLDSLKRAALRHRLARPRSLAWAILLYALPPPIGDIALSINNHRKMYSDMKDRLSMDPRAVIGDDPLSQKDESAWKQHFCDNELKAVILQDVVRTFPDELYFRDKDVQDLMVRVLFHWARCHPHVGYRQGMHEVLAPLLFELFQDRRFAPSDLSSSLKCILDDDYLEHDSYMLFSAVMKGLERFYSTGEVAPTSCGRLPSSKKPHNPNEVIRYLDKVKTEFLIPLDHELAAHLSACNITMELFGIRWLRLLFGREFHRSEIPHLWGFLFADGPSPALHTLCHARHAHFYTRSIGGRGGGARARRAHAAGAAARRARRRAGAAPARAAAARAPARAAAPARRAVSTARRRAGAAPARAAAARAPARAAAPARRAVSTARRRAGAAPARAAAARAPARAAAPARRAVSTARRRAGAAPARAAAARAPARAAAPARRAVSTARRRAGAAPARAAAARAPARAAAPARRAVSTARRRAGAAPARAAAARAPARAAAPARRAVSTARRAVSTARRRAGAAPARAAAARAPARAAAPARRAVSTARRAVSTARRRAGAAPARAAAARAPARAAAPARRAVSTARRRAGAAPARAAAARAPARAAAPARRAVSTARRRAGAAPARAAAARAPARAAAPARRAVSTARRRAGAAPARAAAARQRAAAARAALTGAEYRILFVCRTMVHNWIWIACKKSIGALVAHFALREHICITDSLTDSSWSIEHLGDGDGVLELELDSGSEGVAEGGDVARSLATLALVRARLPPAVAALRAALPRPPPAARRPLNQLLQMAALLQCRNHDLIDVETALEAAEGEENPDKIGRRQLIPVTVNKTKSKNKSIKLPPKVKEVPLKLFHQSECRSTSELPFLDPLRLRTE
ncbi:hypothetical protein ACJJTC_018644 [Scirpophaga incertulas]